MPSASMILSDGFLGLNSTKERAKTFESASFLFFLFLFLFGSGRGVSASSSRLTCTHALPRKTAMECARRDHAVRDLPELFSLGEWLGRNVPASSATAVIHGDYHLDNTLAAKDRPEILAIIDWELATVGDCYMDVALMLMFWGDYRTQEPPAFRALQAVSRRTGVGVRASAQSHELLYGVGLLAIGRDYRGRIRPSYCGQARL